MYLLIHFKGIAEIEQKRLMDPKTGQHRKVFNLLLIYELVLENSKCGLYCKNSNIRKSDTYKTHGFNIYVISEEPTFED